MAGKQLHDYDDAEILRLAPDCGTVAKIGAHIGIPAETLRHYLARNPELRGKVDEAFKRPTVTRPVDDPARLRLVNLETEIRFLRRQGREMEQALAGREQFMDRILEATRVPVETPEYHVRPRLKTGLPARSVILPIYDQQYGQLVRASDVQGGRNHYDSSVYDARQKRWLEGVTGNLRDYAASHAIEEMILVLGGDHVEGDDIFAGQPWQLELDPCRQVWSLACKMEAAVRELVRFAKEELDCPYIAIYGVDDNHGKVGGKRKGAIPVTYSWNWLFQMFLRDKLSDAPIDEFVIEPAGAVFFYGAGLEFQAVHGHHNIRGWGGIPYYGIQRYDAKSVRMHNRLFRYLLMGHIHQPAEITVGTGAEAIVSGDWVGANNLSGDIAAASRPQQKVLFVANKWGITETARIYLTEAREALEPTAIHGRAWEAA